MEPTTEMAAAESSLTGENGISGRSGGAEITYRGQCGGREEQEHAHYAAIVCRDTYYRLLAEYYAGHSLQRPWSADFLQRVIRDMRSIKDKTGTLKKTSQHYGLLRRYELLETAAGTFQVISRPQSRSGITAEDTVRRQVIAYEHLYDKLLDLHLKMGHSRRDKMTKVIRRNFVIPRICVVTFLQLCKVCATGSVKRSEQLQQLQPWPRFKVDAPDSAVVALSTSSDDGFNGHGQVDVIDFRHMPDGEYKWLLRYEDLATKFVSLRPLKSESFDHVAGKLLKVFLQLGAPVMLQSSSGGHRLVSGVLGPLLKSWPSCKIVNAHHKSNIRQDAQLQETADTLETLLRAWMHEYGTSSWSKGCYFVQWRRNTTTHHEIGKTPYWATFGTLPRSGVRSGAAKTATPKLPGSVAPHPLTTQPSLNTPRKRSSKVSTTVEETSELETALTSIPDAMIEAQQLDRQILSSYVLVLDPTEVVMLPVNDDHHEQPPHDGSPVTFD